MCVSVCSASAAHIVRDSERVRCGSEQACDVQYDGVFIPCRQLSCGWQDIMFVFVHSWVCVCVFFRQQ